MNSNTEQALLLGFIHDERSYIQEELAPQIERYKDLLAHEPIQFHGEIINQFNMLIKEHLSDILAKNVGSNAEEIAIALESINVKEYILND
jgi:hypothetical protein